MATTEHALDRGYDGGKQTHGIKRHIGVDTEGLPHAMAVSRANTDDRRGIRWAIHHSWDRLANVERVLGDGGYAGDNFAATIARDLNGADVQIARRPKTSGFDVIPQRWVVERSFAWLEKCRRLWKNAERYLNTSLQFVNLAFLALLLRRL